MKYGLFFSIFFFSIFLFLVPATFAQVCSTDGMINCTSDAECRKPGGTCATMKCISIAGTPKRCVQDAPPTPTPTVTPTPKPTATPTLSVSPTPTAPGSIVPTAMSCSKYDCGTNHDSCIGRLSYCVITSKHGEALSCGCGVPPPPPSPPCTEANKDPNGICQKLSTAIGDIPTTPVGFAKTLFGIALSLSGGIAVILIILSGYQLMSSQGDPEKIQGAKDTITSTIIGLVFIIFSLAVLEIIGIDILRIPGLHY